MQDCSHMVPMDGSQNAIPGATADAMAALDAEDTMEDTPDNPNSGGMVMKDMPGLK
jgi:hypothetical protein